MTVAAGAIAAWLFFADENWWAFGALCLFGVLEALAGRLLLHRDDDLADVERYAVRRLQRATQVVIVGLLIYALLTRFAF